MDNVLPWLTFGLLLLTAWSTAAWRIFTCLSKIDRRLTRIETYIGIDPDLPHNPQPQKFRRLLVER